MTQGTKTLFGNMLSVARQGCPTPPPIASRPVAIVTPRYTPHLRQKFEVRYCCRQNLPSSPVSLVPPPPPVSLQPTRMGSILLFSTSPTHTQRKRSSKVYGYRIYRPEKLTRRTTATCGETCSSHPMKVHDLRRDVLALSQLDVGQRSRDTTY